MPQQMVLTHRLDGGKSMIRPDLCALLFLHPGNPDQPSGLTIANSPLRIYNPSAVNTLNLQASITDWWLKISWACT